MEKFLRTKLFARMVSVKIHYKIILKPNKINNFWYLEKIKFRKILCNVGP